MSDTVQMVCKRCGKEKEYPWKEFTRWLRKNPERSPEDYLCHDCTAGERFRTHGKSKTVLYARWKAMFVRIRGQSKESFKKYYLEKGIKVCPEWHQYEAFEKWALGNGFDPKLVLDRIRSAGHYEPGNCQWITQSENAKKDHAIKISKATTSDGSRTRSETRKQNFP